MARAALLGRLTARAPLPWRVATVAAVVAESPRARTLVLDVPNWPGHLAGQHVDVRLTADDGYQAQRSYSIASAPEQDDAVELTVALVDDGEVSPYFVEELRAGDQFELRGPIGWHFTWSVDRGGPLLLVAGGSGLVPLMAMLRHRAARASDVDARVLISVRSEADRLYAGELAALQPRGLRIATTYTRTPPAAWDGWARRVDAEMLRCLGPDPSARPRVYVCGPTAFVEHVADLLVAAGHDPHAIHAERFG
jgi:ferredoxin-NADP reductase